MLLSCVGSIVPSSQNREKSTSHAKTRSEITGLRILASHCRQKSRTWRWPEHGLRCPGPAVESDGQRPSESPGFERLGMGLGQINLAPAGWRAGWRAGWPAGGDGPLAASQSAPSQLSVSPESAVRSRNWQRANPGKSASTTPQAGAQRGRTEQYNRGRRPQMQRGWGACVGSDCARRC